MNTRPAVPAVAQKVGSSASHVIAAACSFRIIPLSTAYAQRLLPLQLPFKPPLCCCSIASVRACVSCATPARACAPAFARATARACNAFSPPALPPAGDTSRVPRSFRRAAGLSLSKWMRRPGPFEVGMAVRTTASAAAAAPLTTAAGADTPLVAKAAVLASGGSLMLLEAGDTFSPATANPPSSAASVFTGKALHLDAQSGSRHSSVCQPTEATFRWQAQTKCSDFNAAVQGGTKCMSKQMSVSCPPGSSCKTATASACVSVGAPVAAPVCTASVSLPAGLAAGSRRLHHHALEQQRQRPNGHTHHPQSEECVRQGQWRNQQQQKADCRNCRGAAGAFSVCRPGLPESESVPSCQSTRLCTCTVSGHMQGRTAGVTVFGGRTSAAPHFRLRSPASRPALRLQFPAVDTGGVDEAARAHQTPPETTLCAHVRSPCGQRHLYIWGKTRISRCKEGRSSGSPTSYFPAASGAAASFHTAPPQGVPAVTAGGAIPVATAPEALKEKQLSLNNSNSLQTDHVSCAGSVLSSAESKTIGDTLQQDKPRSALQPYADGTSFLQERYGPPRDPSTLMIEPHRLTREERFFQKLFIVAFFGTNPLIYVARPAALAAAALPGVAFLVMLATPVALVRYHVRKLQARMAYTEEVAEELAGDLWGPSFQDCDFPTLRSVIEQPTHAFVFYFHPESLSSQVTLPLLRDIASLFEKLRVRVMIAAVNLAEKSIPDAVRRMFPVALAPHGELLLPFAYHGQQPALQLYDGDWEAHSIVKAVAREVPAASAALDAAEGLEALTEKLSDCLFTLRFVDDRPSHVASTQQQQGMATDLSTPNNSNTAAGATAAEYFVEERARAIGLAKGGLQEALRECQAAREELRAMVQQQRKLQRLP